MTGEGTEKAPYSINNSNDWLAFAKYVAEAEAELCSVKLGDGFVSAGENCFPIVKTLSTVNEALLYAGQPIFTDGDNASKVTQNFMVGTPAGVKWTMVPAQAEIAEGKVTFSKSCTGSAQLIASIGDLERVIDLNLMVETSSVEAIV